MNDPSIERILYQVEIEENKDAQRYTTTGMTSPIDMIFSHIGAYYSDDPQSWTPKKTITTETLYEFLPGTVITLEETDGSVNDYILYFVYFHDLNQCFASACDNNGQGGIEVTVTWHYDTRGYRVIDEYDIALAEPYYIEFWSEINENNGNVPPLKEIDYDFSGTLPEYVPYYGDEYLEIVKEKYPDVKPYGIDYPVEE